MGARRSRNAAVESSSEAKSSGIEADAQPRRKAACAAARADDMKELAAFRRSFGSRRRNGVVAHFDQRWRRGTDVNMRPRGHGRNPAPKGHKRNTISLQVGH